LNKSKQGPQNNALTQNDKVNAITEKSELCTRNTERNSSDDFLTF